MNRKLALTVSCLLIVITAQAQKFSLKFSSATIYNQEQKQVNGYDDGKEFIRTQDISERYAKTLLQNLYIKGILKTKKLELFTRTNTNYPFNLEEETEEEYKFTGTIGDIILKKDLSQLVILNRRVDKDGKEFYYMAVFGKPL